MTTVVFYEKPGCITNTKQKKLLSKLNISVKAIDLISFPWDKVTLKSFFRESSVNSWFNKNAPKIKSGEIVTSHLGEDEALNLLVNDPILIRRPLLELNQKRFCGFDLNTIFKELDLATPPKTEDDLEACSSTSPTKTCP